MRTQNVRIRSAATVCAYAGGPTRPQFPEISFADLRPHSDGFALHPSRIRNRSDQVVRVERAGSSPVAPAFVAPGNARPPRGHRRPAAPMRCCSRRLGGGTPFDYVEELAERFALLEVGSCPHGLAAPTGQNAKSTSWRSRPRFRMRSGPSCLTPSVGEGNAPSKSRRRYLSITTSLLARRGLTQMRNTFDRNDVIITVARVISTRSTSGRRRRAPTRTGSSTTCASLPGRCLGTRSRFGTDRSGLTPR